MIELKKTLDEGKTIKEVSDLHFASFLRYNRGIQNYLWLHAKDRNEKSKVVVIWGPTGSGKSFSVSSSFEPETMYWVPRPKKDDNLWMDGYQSQENVMFDDFRSEWCPHDLLLRICDRYPLQLPVKSSFVKFNAKRIFFTSNMDPRHWYKFGNGGENWMALWRRIDVVIRKDSFDKFTTQKIGENTHEEEFENSDITEFYF